MKMSKVICVRIPNEDVWSSFQAFVALKYGKTKGVLGEEVCRALEKYLQLPENVHAHTQKNSTDRKQSSSRTMKTLTRIAKRIAQEFPNEVPQTEVENIITEEAGGDDRTLRKYMWLLQKREYIKVDRPIFGVNPPKFIFKVNGLETNKFDGVLR